jgi:hypothetical protein
MTAVDRCYRLAIPACGPLALLASSPEGLPGPHPFIAPDGLVDGSGRFLLDRFRI